MRASGFLVAALLLSISIPAHASTKTAVPHHKASTSTVTEVISDAGSLHVSTAPLQTVQDLMAHFQQLDAQLKSLSGKFTQSIELADAGVQRRTDGTLDYEKADRLHLEYRHPERQTVVSNGSTVWVYRRDFNQVIETKLDELKKTDPMVDHILDLGNYENLLKKYDVVFDSATLAVTLRPKDAKEGSDFTLRMKLTGPGRFPSETELTVRQMHVRMIFEELRFNPKLDAALFRFTPPQGADVYRNFKVPMPGGGQQ